MLRAVLRPGRRPAAAAAPPADVTRRRIARWVREIRRRRWDPRRDEFFVPIRESGAFLDTATMPMVLTAVATALFVKILMMVDESKEQERLERKIQKAPAGQGTVRMLTREEWEEIQQVRPRTPFESALARPNARIRTGDPVHLEDVKDWSIDVLTDALSRAQECAKRS
ncbi:cytoplasmic dynein 2 light intermediate chain [Wolffia australiana]